MSDRGRTFDHQIFKKELLALINKALAALFIVVLSLLLADASLKHVVNQRLGIHLRDMASVTLPALHV